jgi:Tripartite tricarboxylate transporter family receptor
MAAGPNVLAVKNASPAHTVADLIALAKANPGTMSYASQGNGSTTHLTMELFLSRTGVKLVRALSQLMEPCGIWLENKHYTGVYLRQSSWGVAIVSRSAENFRAAICVLPGGILGGKGGR